MISSRGPFGLRVRRARSPRILLCTLLCTLAAVLPAAAGPLNVADPLAPASSGGRERAIGLLDRLDTRLRVLVVGAHPDDEDTALIAWVARGLGGEAAYLSLTRGEGGQNLIGPELGTELGILRSRELLAARRVDGGRQFFSRAFDFGYTTSLAETLERWPHEELLEDAVRVLRRFRPQVLVSVFPDGGGGHGQHQAAGRIAAEAFRAAGDPAAFPALAAEGLAPWQPQRFFVSAHWRPESATHGFPLGGLDARTGRSILQIAMDSRSQHRCQEMGQLQPLGEAEGRLQWIAGEMPAGTRDPFAGLDLALPDLARELPAALAPAVEAALTRAAAAVVAVRAASTPGAADVTVLPAAQELVRSVAAAANALAPAAGGDPTVAAVAAAIERKAALAAELLASLAGIAVDAVADRALLVPGEGAELEVTVWDARRHGVTLEDVVWESPDGWETAPAPAEEQAGRQRYRSADPAAAAHLLQRRVRVDVPADAAPSLPYYLERPLRGDFYDWSAAAPELRGEPFETPPLIAHLHLRLGDTRFELAREVVYRFEDAALGERRSGLRVVPPVEVELERDLQVLRLDGPARHELVLHLTAHGGQPRSGQVVVSTPQGWQATELPFRLDDGHRQVRLRLPWEAPAGRPPGEAMLEVRAVLDGAAPPAGAGLALPLIDYPHVRPTPAPRPARLRVVSADLALPEVGTIAYVRGAADRLPEALRDLGLSVEVLAPERLPTLDFRDYQVIVIGPRAYEFLPQLADAEARLRERVRAGALLLVQYQQYGYFGGGSAPFGLELARPHGRVTDETAAVRLLEPGHPVFHWPNRIGPADWDGWVQERGLYMPSQWEEPLRPLLAMADPGAEEQRGSLLIAPLGEGAWVYTGLAFFRQLPAGVPGAYRLFANLLALATDPASGTAADTIPEGAP